jgi:molecular chaperone GrpE (heat shock protein)
MTESTDVGGVIAAALSAAETTPRLLAGVRVEQRERFETLESRMTQLNDRLEGVFEEVRGVHGVLRDMLASHQALSEEHYRRHVLDPIVRVFAPLVDMTYAVRTEETELVEGIRLQLLEVLAHFDIAPICPRTGSAFERESMKPDSSVRTSIRAEDETVASVTKIGFRRASRVLRPATVTVRRFDPTFSAHLAERRPQ